MISQPTFPKLLPLLARACGGTLILSFGVIVLFMLFPFTPTSATWGSQLSRHIVDSASLPLVGVALLCAAAFIQPMPDVESAPIEAMRLASQRAQAMRLCRWGVISLALLAFWQMPLVLGNTSLINQRNLAEASQISPLLQQAEQSILQSSAAELEQRWQQFLAAGSPGLKQPGSASPVDGTDQKRQALLSALRTEQMQINRSINSQGNQARVATVREALRRIALCFVYATGFFALRRSVLWACSTPTRSDARLD